MCIHTMEEALTSSVAAAANESDDEGSFFELEFERGEDQLKRFEEPARNVSISPKDLFFKNRVTPIQPTSRRSQPFTPIPAPQSKSPPKLRLLFALGLSRSRSQTQGGTDKPPKTEAAEANLEKSDAKRLAGEERNGGSRNRNRNKLLEESKRFSRDCVQKYLKFVRPLYVRAATKMQGQGQDSKFLEASPFSSPLAHYFPKKKELRKSRSAAAATTIAAGASVSKRDDSMLMQQDGIQSAIQHCKRSFNSSTDSGRFSRSSSYSCEQLSMDLTRKSIEETIIFAQS